MGLPQGSLLGPILFLLFLNDLPNSISKSFCNLFADDSVFYAQAPTINSAQANLQNDINNVVEWFNNNRFNTCKCVEIILYGGKHPPKFCSIYAVN